MKRLSPEDKLRQARLAIRRWRKRLRRSKRARVLGAAAEVRVVAPPSFSFSKNYHASVSFFRTLKVSVFKKFQGDDRARVFIDLSEVDEISPAVALVLAAEMDRWRQAKRVRLMPRNVNEWQPKVRHTLSGMGFFRLLGVESGSARYQQAVSPEITVLPVVSSTKLEGGKLQPMMDMLSEAANILGQDPLLYPALAEAAYNANLHAYPDDQSTEFPVPAKCWWATACLNIELDIVKFIVYDQGVGIPATLPRSQYYELIRDWLPAGIKFATADESRLIEAAIKVDRSSLVGGHGKGLKDVITPIDKTRGSKVRLLSGKGRVIYHHGGEIERGDGRLHLGGTLVEWTIPVDSYHQE